MAREKTAFGQSLKSALTKLALPGQQRVAVEFLLMRYISEVNVIAVLNQLPQKRTALLSEKNSELLNDLSELADTETPTPGPSAAIATSPPGPATA